MVFHSLKTYFELVSLPVSQIQDYLKEWIQHLKSKNLKGRWGSASNRIIRLNVNLLKLPLQIIDYVIIHELCHLRIQNHSFHFWNLLKKFLPKYDERKIWLDQNGIDIS